MPGFIQIKTMFRPYGPALTVGSSEITHVDVHQYKSQNKWWKMRFSLHVQERHIDEPHCARGSSCPMLTHERPPPTSTSPSQNTHALPRLLWHALILPQPRADLSTVADTVHVITWKYDKHAVRRCHKLTVNLVLFKDPLITSADFRKGFYTQSTEQPSSCCHSSQDATWEIET